MAILDFSKDSSKSIAIHFHTKELGPEGQPLYYHTPENPAGKALPSCSSLHSVRKCHYMFALQLLTLCVYR